MLTLSQSSSLIIVVLYFQGQLLATSVTDSCRAAGSVCSLILQSLTLQPWYHPVTEPTDHAYFYFTPFCTM